MNSFFIGTLTGAAIGVFRGIKYANIRAGSFPDRLICGVIGSYIGAVAGAGIVTATAAFEFWQK